MAHNYFNMNPTEPGASVYNAPGFNPYGLSVTDVGSGYRLLEKYELASRPNDHPLNAATEYFLSDERRFRNRAGGWEFGDGSMRSKYTFRTKLTHQELAQLDEQYAADHPAH